MLSVSAFAEIALRQELLYHNNSHCLVETFSHIISSTRFDSNSFVSAFFLSIDF